MTDNQMIDQMFAMQRKLNDSTFPTCGTADLNWNRAVWLECAEALDSTPWKWWKKQEIDHDNIKVELVDIWHFMMSGIMASGHEELLRELIEESVNSHAWDVKITEISSVQYCIDHMAYNALSNYWSRVFDYFYQIWYGYYGLEIKDLYVAYMTKNVLNHFRQENGYKDGSYKKMWNGEEDNVVTFRIASTLEISETFPELLHSELTKYYSSL